MIARAAVVAALVFISVDLFSLGAPNGAVPTHRGCPEPDAFAQPPKGNYPETWFHFIGGNVSREGIDADLEAIARAGISGVQWFHGHFGGPWPGTTRQIRALTPEWEELVAHLAEKADSLGLRLTIQTCPGWAMAGGPWIEPENAMRRLVWSRTDVEGFEKITLPVGKPSAEEWRDYQDICVLAFPTPLGDTGEPLRPADVRSEEAGWAEMIEGGWKMVSEEGVAKSRDGAAKYQPVDLPAGSEHSFTFSLPAGEVIRTLELPSIGNICYNDVYDPAIHVCLTAEWSDGSQRTLVDADLPKAAWQHSDGEIFLACEEIGLSEKGSGSEGAVSDGATPGTPRYTLTLRNGHRSSLPYLRFWSAARKNNWRGEAGWALIAKESTQEHTLQDTAAFIRPEDILDLSDRLKADGTLDWTAPEGRWTVLRIGHVNLGRRNSPAPPEATGWECNKLDPRGAETQFAHYVGALQGGPMDGRADGMLMDSWECQTQTWTAGMEEEFAGAAGYSLRAWMPALLGYVIGNQENTSSFLIDWRRTVNGLYCENFFRRMTDLAHEKGLTVQYETAGGDVVVMDPLEYYKYADVPMCEFWQPVTEGFVGDLDFKPIRPTASAAHLYGKPRVAAESFTSFNLTWDEHWQMLREVANLNMAEGVTHNVFHTYTHNPQVGFLPPGTSFGSAIGTPFLRGQTWWKYMPLFTAFLARTSYMLEQGRTVAQILWYLGDEVGHRPYQYTGNGTRQTGPYRIPEGFDYDYCTTDALLHRLSVVNGRICTPEGISYEVLWIPENERMLPETVSKLEELIRAGARVIASAPLAPATLSGGEEAVERFEKAVREVWGEEAFETPSTNAFIRRLGKGALAIGVSLDDALRAFKMRPHLICSDPDLIWEERSSEFVSSDISDTTDFSATRRAGKARWFFLAAPVGREFHGEVRLLADLRHGSGFRPGRRHGNGWGSGWLRGIDFRRLRAEWWDPVDGSVHAVPFRRQGRYVEVRLDLAQAEGGFLVLRRGPEKHKMAENVRFKHAAVPEKYKNAENVRFKRAAVPEKYKIAQNVRSERDSVCVDGWTIRFPEGWGAPTEPTTITELKAWKDLGFGPEASAFSGTATYETTFDLPEGFPPASSLTDRTTDETPTPFDPKRHPRKLSVVLDLGTVDFIAEVTVNGQPAGVRWTPPYRLDISDLVHAGTNTLTVDVTSTWYNRLTYDASQPEAARKTWTISGPAPGSPLRPSGLLGPVTLHY